MEDGLKERTSALSHACTWVSVCAYVYGYGCTCVCVCVWVHMGMCVGGFVCGCV